jgi:hypothetical protein
MALQITSTDEQKVPVTLNPTTAAGNPATVEGLTVTVDVGDATIVEIEANKSFYVVSGTAGLNSLTVSADADLGEGVVTITDTIEYFVTGAQATSFGLSAGAAEAK